MKLHETDRKTLTFCINKTIISSDVIFKCIKALQDILKLLAVKVLHDIIFTQKTYRMYTDVHLSMYIKDSVTTTRVKPSVHIYN